MGIAKSPDDLGRSARDKARARRWQILAGSVLGVVAAIFASVGMIYHLRAEEKLANARRFSLHRLYASQSRQPACPEFAVENPPTSPLLSGGVCVYDQSASCDEDSEKVAEAGLPMDTYCSALFEPGGCLDAARTYGVSASCLCSVVISERAWSDHDLFTKRFTDDAGIGSTVGCIQQNPVTLWDAIQKLKACRPAVLKKFSQADLSLATKEEIRSLVMESCSNATQLAALWLVAQAHPDCNEGEQGTCASFAENWNPGDGGRLNGGTRGLLNFGPQIRFKARLAFGILSQKPALNSPGLPGGLWAGNEARMAIGPQLEFEGPPYVPEPESFFPLDVLPEGDPEKPESGSG